MLGLPAAFLLLCVLLYVVARPLLASWRRRTRVLYVVGVVLGQIAASLALAGATIAADPSFLGGNLVECAAAPGGARTACVYEWSFLCGYDVYVAEGEATVAAKSFAYSPSGCSTMPRAAHLRWSVDGSIVRLVDQDGRDLGDPWAVRRRYRLAPTDTLSGVTLTLPPTLDWAEPDPPPGPDHLLVGGGLGTHEFVATILVAADAPAAGPCAGTEASADNAERRVDTCTGAGSFDRRVQRHGAARGGRELVCRAGWSTASGSAPDPGLRPLLELVENACLELELDESVGGDPAGAKEEPR